MLSTGAETGQCHLGAACVAHGEGDVGSGTSQCGRSRCSDPSRATGHDVPLFTEVDLGQYLVGGRLVVTFTVGAASSGLSPLGSASSDNHATLLLGARA